MARDLTKKLCDIRPDQPAYLHERGRALANLARIAHAESDDATARDLFRQAIAQHEQVLTLCPERALDKRLRELARKELEALKD